MSAPMPTVPLDANGRPLEGTALSNYLMQELLKGRAAAPAPASGTYAIPTDANGDPLEENALIA